MRSLAQHFPFIPLQKPQFHTFPSSHVLTQSLKTPSQCKTLVNYLHVALPQPEYLMPCVWECIINVSHVPEHHIC